MKSIIIEVIIILCIFTCLSTLIYILEPTQPEIDPDGTLQHKQIIIGIIIAVIAYVLSAILCLTLGITIMRVAQHRRSLKNRYECTLSDNILHYLPHNTMIMIILDHIWIMEPNTYSMLQT